VTDHDDIVLELEGALQPVAEQLVIIHDQNRDRLQWSALA
jgi:hypothetical protein